MSTHTDPTDSRTAPKVAEILHRTGQVALGATARGMLILYAGGVWIASVVGLLVRPPQRERKEVLLTGTFYANNWLRAHVMPLAAAAGCGKIVVITTNTVSAPPKTELIYPPRWFRRLVGDVPARLMTFIWIGILRRPDIVGGFHLLFNGMAAILLSRLIGAKSLYFCVGGPTETLHGGRGENRLFKRLDHPSEWLRKRLLRTAANADVVITMGERAKRFFLEMGPCSTVTVMPGGIDLARFSGTEMQRDIDMIIVARLAEVKRIELFLDIVRTLVSKRRNLRAVVVGDGPLRQELVSYAETIAVKENVNFVGQRSDVEAFVKRAKVFVLTSRSEGLPLVLIEALTCGTPVVSSNVGEIGDLVKNGYNGWLIDHASVEEFSRRIEGLLMDGVLWRRFSERARRKSMAFGQVVTQEKWEKLLSRI